MLGLGNNFGLGYMSNTSNWALDGHFAASNGLELAFRGHFEVPRIGL